jgi:hypothetical protein
MPSRGCLLQSTSETSDCRKILKVRRQDRVPEKVWSWDGVGRGVSELFRCSSGFGLVLGKSLLQRKNPGHRIDGSRFRRCLSENDEHQHGLMNNATKRGWDGRYRAPQPECVVDLLKRLLQQWESKRAVMLVILPRAARQRDLFSIEWKAGGSPVPVS